MWIGVEGGRGEEGHCAEGYVGEIFWLLLLLLLLRCATIGLRLGVGVAGVWVCGVGVGSGSGSGVEGGRSTAATTGEVGEVEVRDVEVAGVGFDGEVFVPFVLGGVVLVGRP